MPEYFEVIAKARFRGEEIRNVFVIQTAGAFDIAICEQACNAIRDLYNDYLAASIVIGMDFYEFAFRNVSAPSMPEIPSTAPPVAGLAGADMLPKGVSGVLHLRSTSGRPNRGMKYIPGPTEASNNPDATPSAAYRTTLEAFGAGILAINGGASPYKVVIARRGAGNVVTEANEVTVVRASQNWGALKSRANGR